jgi:membrane fusion protein (multidrug efflux system)
MEMVNTHQYAADELLELPPDRVRMRAESEVKGPLLRDLPTADPPAPRPGAAEPSDASRRRGRSRRAIRASLGALLATSVAVGGYLYWDNARHFESTDDAFIAARQFSVAPKVSGYLTAVPVTDNQHVAAGDVIARIDDRDYRTALAQAEAQVDAAQASIANTDAQIAVQEAQVRASVSQVQQQQASLTYAQQEASRYSTLARDGWGTVETSQQWASQQRQGEASLQAAKDAVVATARQLAVLKAQHGTAEANLAQAEAQRDQARLNLSYTTVVAAQPGRIVQLGAADGQYAQPGTALTQFVPDDIWVVANFKENQLDHMRPRQPVMLQIDAYPEHTVLGHVASVQPGSGTAFSLLPAENATGNYVKIVQRPGMSVVPTVRIDPTPSLFERLRRWS